MQLKPPFSLFLFEEKEKKTTGFTGARRGLRRKTGRRLPAQSVRGGFGGQGKDLTSCPAYALLPQKPVCLLSQIPAAAAHKRGQEDRPFLNRPPPVDSRPRAEILPVLCPSRAAPRIFFSFGPCTARFLFFCAAEKEKMGGALHQPSLAAKPPARGPSLPEPGTSPAGLVLLRNRLVTVYCPAAACGGPLPSLEGERRNFSTVNSAFS